MRGIRAGMTLLDADGIYLGVVSEVVVSTIGRGYLVAGCVTGRSWRVPLALVRWVLDGAVRLSVPNRLVHSVDVPTRSGADVPPRSGAGVRTRSRAKVPPRSGADVPTRSG